jgi:DNA-directed RNA polymerase subunit M/transcription elongation factor TFIIS
MIADAALLQKKRMALIVCKRCNSDDVEKEDRQTRSADEGTTGFYHCNKCSHSWKHSG